MEKLREFLEILAEHPIASFFAFLIVLSLFTGCNEVVCTLQHGTMTNSHCHFEDQ